MSFSPGSGSAFRQASISRRSSYGKSRCSEVVRALLARRHRACRETSCSRRGLVSTPIHQRAALLAVVGRAGRGIPAARRRSDAMQVRTATTMPRPAYRRPEMEMTGSTARERVARVPLSLYAVQGDPERSEPSHSGEPHHRLLRGRRGSPSTCRWFSGITRKRDS